MSHSTSPTILTNALANFDRAAELLRGQFDDNLLAALREPKERIELSMNPQKKDDTLHHVRGFIVRHTDALGPSKGGIRMSETVTLDDITGLAMEMTWKCALIGVPFGGGKSGIVADARTLNAFDKETIIRSFARNSHRHVGPQIYVPAPDMGTNERDMGHFKDAIAFSQGIATTQGCYVTGKPIILGGIPGRREATGRGVVVCALKALQNHNIAPQKATAIVQGFGNVGLATALLLAQAGTKVIAVSDITAAVHNTNGLDIAALQKHVATTGGIRGYAAPNTTSIDGQAMLELPCDILIPAASANQITIDNAKKIHAKMIVEGANGPTSVAADEILAARNIPIYPDILANAGGVFVSYLEYTQETQAEQMTEEAVRNRLTYRMQDRFDAVNQTAQSRNLSLRDAAMTLAVKTVCEALEAKGRLP
ncbi:MAG: Glu/Leu/Phe/Val dehydrogenase [Phycisphaerales bacterium]|nr:Glu/Leu/Phe/Val dehydrogenase [Phycisphaerales bacterium]